MNGVVTQTGRITAGELTAQGALSLGTIDSNDVRIEFEDRSRIAGIHGLRVLISRKALSLLQSLFTPASSSRNSFCTIPGGIQGDVVTLENVISDTVSGNDVIIGPGCQINKVRYRDHIYIDEAAWVGWYEPIDGEGTNNP